jgi:mRNA interferase RelE/StbE
MPYYTIQFKSSALKELRKLSKEFSEQIARDINDLAKNPRPHGHKKLKSSENLYRIRSGNYRVIYQIQDNILIVLVVRIGDRKEVYRDL